jgi:hypothetical protein
MTLTCLSQILAIIVVATGLIPQPVTFLQYFESRTYRSSVSLVSRVHCTQVFSVKVEVINIGVFFEVDSIARLHDWNRASL